MCRGAIHGARKACKLRAVGLFVCHPPPCFFLKSQGSGSTNGDPPSGADCDRSAIWISVHLPSRPSGHWEDRSGRRYAKRAPAMLRREPPPPNKARQRVPSESSRSGQALSPLSPRLFPQSHAKRAQRCFARSRPRRTKPGSAYHPKALARDKLCPRPLPGSSPSPTRSERSDASPEAAPAERNQAAPTADQRGAAPGNKSSLVEPRHTFFADVARRVGRGNSPGERSERRVVSPAQAPPYAAVKRSDDVRPRMLYPVCNAPCLTARRGFL
jgi:hypothetical protein